MKTTAHTIDKHSLEFCLERQMEAYEGIKKAHTEKTEKISKIEAAIKEYQAELHTLKEDANALKVAMIRINANKIRLEDMLKTPTVEIEED